MKPNEHVAIIGAGISGLALAIRLRRTGRNVTVYEARERAALGEGAFLTLASNGVNALRALGLAEQISTLGMPTRGFEIVNGRGRQLACLDETETMRQAGALSVTLRRADLMGTLLEAVEEQGTTVKFGHALSTVTQAETVNMQFANGEEASAEWIAGCDGVWSRTRRLTMPGAPEPAYTGLTGTGGVIDLPDVPETSGLMHMVFGENAFFGYIKEGDGPVFWFNSFAASEAEAVAKADPQKLAQTVRRLHANDPFPVNRISRALTSVPRSYPVFDMEHLPRWYKGKMVLLGDAAHAISPHAGQGASIAIEDAVVLGACIDEADDPAAAFARYQRLRQARVEDVIRISRRNGSQKQTTSRIGLFIRDLILPIVIPLGAKSTRAVTLYRADRAPLEQPEAV